ncbi:mucin-2-like [Lytechinus pictus]|uniref:mucin-2-like n=1 Tax=Lytechinus pictus TaxID=7653 RepID=UPI0030BA23AB
MALLTWTLFPRQTSGSVFRCQRVQGFSIYLLMLLANITQTDSNNVTTSMEFEYTTIFITNSTIEMFIPSTSITASTLSSQPSSSVESSFDVAPSTALYPSPTPSGISQIWTSDVTTYTEMTSDLVSIINPTIMTSPVTPMSRTSTLSQSLVSPIASHTVISTEEVRVTSSILEYFSPSFTEFSSSPSSSLGTSFIKSIPTESMPPSVPMPTTFPVLSLSSSLSSSPSSQSLFPSSFPSSYMASPSSNSVNEVLPSSSAAFTTTQSLSSTHIVPTTSPPVDPPTQLPLTTAGPDQLSILQWFGIAVGGAAVLFIFFLLFHCYQLRQRAIRKQKKEMKKEILDFSQSNRNDRISSWRNSLALDAMATHIELPHEDSMDMQAMDNLGFEEVFLGDEPKSNNNYFLPQTNL